MVENPSVAESFTISIYKYIYIYIYIVADPGWRDSHPVLGATITTAVSGVYNADRLSTGLGSRVFNHDTNVLLVPCQLGK